MSNTAILPARFESGDLIAWLHEFNACCAANGWTVNETTDHKILKIPAFLRGQAASHFYAIPEEKRSSYTDAVKELKKAMCPAAHCKNFFVEFEQTVTPWRRSSGVQMGTRRNPPKSRYVVIRGCPKSAANPAVLAWTSTHTEN